MLSCWYRAKTGWGGKKMNRVAVRQFSFSSGKLLGLFSSSLTWIFGVIIPIYPDNLYQFVMEQSWWFSPSTQKKKPQTLRRFLYEMVTVLHSNVSSAMGWRHSWSFLATLVVWVLWPPWGELKRAMKKIPACLGCIGGYTTLCYRVLSYPIIGTPY